MRSLFVLSTGRTGTDTLRHLLALAPEVDAYHEPRPQLIRERKRGRWEVGENPELYRRIFLQARRKKMLYSFIRRKVYVETSARLTFFAPVIAELLPRARFVYLHRHPADVVVSGMRRGWYVNHPADFGRIEPVPGEAAYEEWARWDPFRKICWYWDAYNRFALDVRDGVGPERVLTVSTDDFFSGKAIPEIFRHIGVPMPPEDRVREELARKHNAQTTASFPSFGSWTEEMRGVLYEMTGETMERLGYAREETVSIRD